MDKTKLKKVFSVLMSILMVLSSITSISPLKIKALEQDYEIYPKPHLVSYQEGNFKLDNLNIVYESTIDNETKARVNEVLALKGLSANPSNEIKEGMTNILVGTKGSNEVVDQYVSQNMILQTNQLFTKLDSYLLSSNNGTIVVLGKDTDAAFYGITTLYHIVKQLKDTSIRNFTIEDYADVSSRGFIEGYYGNPWSTQDRQELMKWGGYYKLNSYFYAPKDDPKHNSSWRELYTAEEIETKIKPLAKVGNESKCRFVFALHPYMYNPIRYNTEENYQNDLKVMQAKFAQVIEAGVRQIAILADDANNVGGSNYIRTLNDMSAWLKEMQKTYPDLKLTLPFCTQEYMYNGQSYYRDFPENVQIVMTGGRVWGEVSNEFTTTFTNNAGRGPYMWINWPCSDNSKNHLIMGGYSNFLHPGVDANKIQGIVLNPMQQSEPSKVAIFGNACYSWNIWESKDEADQAWTDSFKYVDHNSAIETDASNALRELSKHMINQNMDNRVVSLEESEQLKLLLTPFKEQLATESIDEEKANEIINEFKKLQTATTTYSQKAGDQRLKSQIIYWLNCWKDTNEAAINYLEAIKAVKNNEDKAVIWDYFAKGQAAFAKSKTYGFNYVDHTEYAEVGVQHIVPFIKALEQYLSQKVQNIVNPDKQIISVITSRQDTPAQSTDLMLDGDEKTFALWKTPNSSKEGEYVGVTYSKEIKLNEVRFLMSDSATNHKNTFSKAKLQYTIDGINWLNIEGTEQENKALELSAKGLDLTVKGVRVVCTQQTPDIWLAIREIYVNNEPIKPQSGSLKVISTSAYKEYDGNVASNLLDDNDNSYVWYKTNTGDISLVGDYVGVDLGEVKPIQSVRFIMGYDGDYWDEYDLEYSTDGETYTKFEHYTQDVNKKIIEEDFSGIKARYIRVRNTVEKKTWLKMAAFTVTPDPLNYSVVETNREDLKDLSTIIAHDVTLINPVTSITLNQNDYIGVDVGRIKDLTSIDMELINGNQLTLQSSKNKVYWQEVTNLSELEDARYVRLINLTTNAITFELQKFEVHSKEIVSPYLYETSLGITPGWGEAEDSRHNGAAFDQNVDTTTEFGTLPNKDDYIIYDLGQKRIINKIALFSQDVAVNYIRDAEILISNSLDGEWTKVVTIGDGVENVNDANVKCIDSDAGYKTSSTYPNKVSVEATANNVEARYLKIHFTARNQNRAVLFNEIMINNGEYVPVSNDPTFESNCIEESGFVPQNMIDGDVSTSYRPNTKDAGYITYTLSDHLDVKKMNIVQAGVASQAKVLALVDGANGQEWIEVGKLDKSLVEIQFPLWDRVYAIKFVWEANQIPTISEIVTLTSDEYRSPVKELIEFVDGLDCDPAHYTASSYTQFENVLNEAQKVITSPTIYSYEKVQRIFDDLKAAATLLVERGDDKAIENRIELLSKLDKFLYTQESWKNLEKVIEEAKALLEKDHQELSKTEVDEMVEKLDIAKSNLVTLVSISKEALNEYIVSNQLDQLDTSLYLTKTAKPFEEALAKAHVLIEKEDVTFDELEEAMDMLRQTRNGLVLKATDDKIEALKVLLANYKEENYTASSWKEYVKTTTKVEQALEDELSHEQVQQLMDELNKAAQLLVTRGNCDGLLNLIESAEELDKSKYTKETYSKLVSVITEVKKALDNKNDLTQENVDTLVQKLHDAIDGLETVSNSNSNTSNGGVQTGDTTTLNLFIGLMFVSGLLASGIYVAHRKKREN